MASDYKRFGIRAIDLWGSSQLEQFCAAEHLEPAFTDDGAVFTDTVHYVVMINGFLLLIHIADANLHAT